MFEMHIAVPGVVLARPDFDNILDRAWCELDQKGSRVMIFVLLPSLADHNCNAAMCVLLRATLSSEVQDEQRDHLVTKWSCEGKVQEGGNQCMPGKGHVEGGMHEGSQGEGVCRGRRNGSSNAEMRCIGEVC